jgi:hypothetical protein
MLVVAIVAENRVQGGFMHVIDRVTDGKSLWEVIGGSAAGLAVFAGWGAIIGALALTLSAWSRRKAPKQSRR